MKLRFVDGTEIPISNIQNNGTTLNIITQTPTCEELTEKFSQKENLSTLYVYESDKLSSVITGFVVLNALKLNIEDTTEKTVILGRETNITEERITKALSQSLAASTKADLVEQKTTESVTNIENALCELSETTDESISNLEDAVCELSENISTT